MGITRNKEQVRDGFFADLPEDLQTKVMNIHKLIKDAVDDLLNNTNYADLKESQWAMSCIDEFCVQPKDKSAIGSVRVYKKGKTFKCMIQATGHFRNHQYGWIEELLHEFICNIYGTVRPKIRRKYDMTITNEGRTGEPYEGFDIYPNPKTVPDLWEKFEDRKTKVVTEYTEDTDEVECTQDLLDYYESYHNLSYDEFFLERSNGKLTSSFRIAVNIKNGHFIKLVFDLNSKDIKQIGDHANQQDRSGSKDPDIKKNIQKNGHNNFSSRALLKAIVDMDTKQNLQTVTTIGVIGSNSDTTRFNVPEKYRNSSLGDDSSSFSAYPANIREKIADDLKLNPPDAITFNVGEMEQIPSYKATKLAGSISGLYNNQWKKGRGVTQTNKFSQRINSDINISKAVELIESKFKKAMMLVDKDDEDVMDYEDMFNKTILRIKKTMESNKNDNFGQTVADPRYNRAYRMLEECLDAIQRKIKRKQKKETQLESTDTPEYNVDMSEVEAKRTLRTLSQSIINDVSTKKDHKVTQYTANIYANIITKNLLPLWAKGFRKVSISLDSYQSFFTFEFKVPNMTQDFVARFVEGRESINGFIHRQSEIKIKMSPRIFHTMKNPDDAYNFFKSAIRYYDGALERYSEKLMVEIMKLNREMKHLIATTKMSGIVTYPMTLLFVFDDVKMDTKDTFRISQEDIKTINSFIHNIYTKYASPDKEKKQIVDDVRDMVKVMKESCDASDPNIRQLTYLPEAVESYLFGGYTTEIQQAEDNWINENIDKDWINFQKNYNLKYLQESFGVKKLKKIPTDLVAYITIEAESIKDSNDKMMISSYCLGKIEIVEWYIELLEVGSKKYIVPHTKPYLEGVRTQLLACFKKIMDTPIPKKDRPLLDIQYPAGYEG